jgi:hypothetical protein
MVPRKHVPPTVWRLAGDAGDGCINPTQWLACGWPTLHEPLQVSLDQLHNKDVYAILISRHFTKTGSLCAFPRAFEPEQPWRYLLNGANDQACQREVGRAFSTPCPDAMTRRVRQTVWQLRTCGLPIGARTGAERSSCPITLLAYRQEIPETHELVAFGNPTALLVWRHVLHAYHTAVAGHSWARIASRPGRGMLSREAKRAILLGLAPNRLTTLRDDFHLLCGLVLHELVTHRHRLSRSLSAAHESGATIEPYSVSRAAATIYQRIRASFQNATTEELRRAQLLVKQMRRAGLPPESYEGPSSPLARFYRDWVDTGVCRVLPPQGTLQLLLPPAPPATLELPAWMGRRLVPCREASPPPNLPLVCSQAYLALAPRTATNPSAWSVVVVHGGDGGRDLHATLQYDAAAPVPRATAGGHPMDTAESLLYTACQALDMILRDADGGPVTALLRFPQEDARAADTAMLVAAGLWDHPKYRRAAADFLRLQRLTLSTPGSSLWFAGWLTTHRYAWGERASAIADHGRLGAHGHLPTLWDGVPRAPPFTLSDSDCCICMCPFSEPLPTAALDSCSATGMWRAPCRHAVCRECDITYQDRGPNNSCPLCRAPRVVLLQP